MGLVVASDEARDATHAMAFAAASYVVWFGAVKFMYESGGAVKGRAWITSFNVQLPKFYFQCLCLHVLLHLSSPMVSVVLVFQMIVFVVTDAITPTFSHSAQVRAALTRRVIMCTRVHCIGYQVRCGDRTVAQIACFC